MKKMDDEYTEKSIEIINIEKKLICMVLLFLYLLGLVIKTLL
jgi:hypothetical protein